MQHDFSLRRVVVLAIATSIDDLAVGVTFAFLDVAILALIGVAANFRFASRYKQKAEIAGEVILILIGLKILLEHTGVV